MPTRNAAPFAFALSTIALVLLVVSSTNVGVSNNTYNRELSAPIHGENHANLSEQVALNLISTFQNAPPTLWAKLASLSIPEIQKLLQPTVWHTADPYTVHSALIQAEAKFQLELGIGSYFGGFVTGCVAGGIVGGVFGAGVGAGVGCVVGGAATDLALYFFGQEAGISAQTLVERQFQIDQATALYNMYIEFQGFVTSITSVLNSTFPAFASMADNAALAQLGNSSFNVAMDMNMSSIPIQMAALYTTMANSLSGGIYALNQAETNAYNPTGTFHSGATAQLELLMAASGTAPTFGYTNPTNTYYSKAQADIDTSTSVNYAVAINNGYSVIFSCTSAPATFVSAPSSAANQNQYVTLNVPANGTLYYTATFNTVWTQKTGNPCDIEGLGMIGVPIGALSPTSTITIVGCGTNSVTFCQVFAHASFQFSGRFQFCATVPGTGCPDYTQTFTVGNGATSSFPSSFKNLFVTAQTNAQTYWSYLRFLGYNNSNQIPSNCIIPMPNQILPPQFDNGIGSLTLNQTMSLYYAYMNGLATFFNTPAGDFNVSTVCNGHPIYQVSSTNWNLNTNILGFVFTLPVAHQNFGVTSTWTVTNASSSDRQVGNVTHLGSRTNATPIIVWPLIKTLYAKIGVVQEVPIDNPLFVYVPKNGTLYELQGNGTSESATGFSNGTVSSSTGAALFITSCKVRNLNTGSYDNAPGSYCPLVLSNITTVKFNTTGSNVPPLPVGACATGNTLIDPLTSFFNSITFGIGGCTFDTILAYLFLAIVAAIIIWLIASVVSYFRKEE